MTDSKEQKTVIQERIDKVASYLVVAGAAVAGTNCDAIPAPVALK